MSDTKQSPQALTFAVLLDLAKTMAEMVLLSRQQLEELKTLTAALTDGDPLPLPVAAAAAAGAPATTAAPAAAAPAPANGMEKLLETLISEEMGIDAEQLRTGNLDVAVVRKMLRDRKAGAKPSTNETGG